MLDEEKVADSITRYLIGDSTQALKELELLKNSFLNVSNNANSTKDYSRFFKKTYERVLKIIKQ
jgi:hypothetical protein